MELTSTDIEEINSLCPNSEQGIYKQPYGIPVDVKDYVIYMRHETGGWRGGGYGGDGARPYTNEESKPKFKVLDLTLKRLFPNLSFLQFREIEELIRTNEETDREYYGNSTNYLIEYIELKKLYDKIEELKNES